MMTPQNLRTPQPELLPPHSDLLQYYGAQCSKTKFLANLFDHSAADYNRIDQILSFGSGLWHRRQALLKAGLSSGMHALDLACGPGTTTRQASAIVEPNGFVIGLDLSSGMLREAQRHGCRRIVMASAERLPFGESTFDFVTMAYALRHVLDLRTMFKECSAVLKPGGRLLILEIARPESKLQLLLARSYLRSIVPRLIRLTSSNTAVKPLLEYYWATIETAVAPYVVVKAMKEAGFAHAAASGSLGGLVMNYLAIKPASFKVGI